MSPEFYAIIGVGVSLAGFMLGLFLFFNSQIDRRFNQVDARFDRLEDRVDRLEARFDRLEDKIDRIQEQIIVLERRIAELEQRVAKLDWMLDAALYGKPVRILPESDNGDAG